MPIGVALIRPSAAAIAAARSVAGDRTPGAEMRCADCSASACGAARIDVDSVRCSTPRSACRVGHRRRPPRRRRSARRGRSAASGSPRRKLSAKPDQSVLWPMRLPSRSSTVLTAPIAARVVRQFVQQRDDRLLAGMRDVQPVEPHALGRRQQLRQRVGAEAQRVPGRSACRCSATPAPPPSCSCSAGAAGGLDAGADQAEEDAARGCGMVCHPTHLHLARGARPLPSTAPELARCGRAAYELTG